ncbi:multidrug resistance-associated protein 1-like [Physella acuta]|uniref:multidrug resistance-associated protein 1-like n=1 Tax=Physella acuta TaxID=109671 RepID=UPI0027DE859F|nr:multidrug resistance-associated protein 1-like [Physella acuta]
MEKLCGDDKLWDTDLTWSNSTWPQFTECFQDTVLTWAACGWLWLSAPFYAYHLLSIERKNRRLSVMFGLKLFFSLAIFVVNIFEVFDGLQSHAFISANVLAPVTWMATMVLNCCFVYLEWTKYKVRSPVLFLFWTLTAVVSLVPFYTSIILKKYDTNTLPFAMVCTKFGVHCCILILYGFADNIEERNQDDSPEISASLLSWLSLGWYDRLVWKGFRSQLKNEDIYNLNPRDKAKRAYRKLLHVWDNETEKSSNIRSRRTKYKLSQDWENEIPLLPVDHVKNAEDRHVEETQSFDSDEQYGFSKVMFKGNNKEIPEPTDLDGTDSKDAKLQREIDSKNRAVPRLSMLKIMLKCYWMEAVSCQWGIMMFVVTHIISPILLGWLIDFTKDTSEQVWHGYIYALAFILARIMNNVFGVLAKWLNLCFAARVRSAGIATVLRKALTMSNEARKESTVGEIVNLMSVDMGHIEKTLGYSFWSWLCVAFFVMGIYLLYQVIGVSLLAGLGFIFLMFAANLWVMQKMRSYHEQMMRIKDERIKVTNEVLNGIKVIKLYGWEPMFMKKILDIRDDELKILRKYSILSGVQTFAWHVSMVWSSYLMLVTYVLISDNHYLDASTAFMSINYGNVIKLAVNMLPMLMKDVVKCKNSLKRLNKLINSDDINMVNMIRNKHDSMSVRIEDADFAWEKSGPQILKSINLCVPPGQMVAVVGAVGSGKSSLLSAMLGEMHKINGYFNINSSTAYVPQLAWIQNNTLKENILFGRKYQFDFYQQTIKACALEPDLDILPARDGTEIGEKGINLSGGQKQRVSLARAVYSQADIYLLDDPLSAVDSHVGKHIFDHVLSNEGLLAGKTRILVTHGIHWLPMVDHIIVMKDGTISESGTYEELLSHNGAFAQFLTQYLTRAVQVNHVDSTTDDLFDETIKADILKRLASVASDASNMSEQAEEDLKNLVSVYSSKHSLNGSEGLLNNEKISTSKGSLALKSNEKLGVQTEILKSAKDKGNKSTTDRSRLTSDEKMQQGKVNWSVYGQLMKSIGVYNCITFLTLFIIYQIIYNYSNVWLANWTDDAGLNNFTMMPGNSTNREDRNNYYIGVYAGLAIAMTFFDVGYAVFFQLGHIRASRNLHSDLLSGIMHSPMSFFDTTPIGRILNRFSQDIDSIDDNIFIEIETCLDNLLRCIGTIIVMSYTMPIFLSVVVPIVIILIFIQQLYMRTSCQLRRISSNNRSPVYSHFSETLSGVSVIRAYQAQDRFIAESLEKIDLFQKGNIASKTLNKWLEARLNMLNYVVIVATAIFAVYYREDLSPGLVGLAVTYAIKVSSDMNVLTMVFGDLEGHVVSVERIDEYSSLPSEKPWDNQEKTAEIDWPSSGKIQFVNYSTQYRDELDLVLNDVNVTFQGGEKIGVVGRTGAGKSSMVLSLFRLIEATSGQIIIDGVDIANIGLHTLRRQLTILPQDPVLFAGSLRMNLDPFNENSDAEIWKALEHSHLKCFVEELPSKLEHNVGEGGHSLSMGQRQLICLARTLLRKSKIFILDEATASVDMETDDLIQKSIRESFKDCTVITIAHRLNTVMDYDRILVLDNGQIVEFDTPKNLLERQDSMFYSLASQAGLV